VQLTATTMEFFFVLGTVHLEIEKRKLLIGKKSYPTLAYCGIDLPQNDMKCKKVKRIKIVELRRINLWPQETLPSGVRNAQSHGPKMIFPGFQQNHFGTPRLPPDLFSMAILAADAGDAAKIEFVTREKAEKDFFFGNFGAHALQLVESKDAKFPLFPRVFRLFFVISCYNARPATQISLTSGAGKSRGEGVSSDRNLEWRAAALGLPLPPRALFNYPWETHEP